MMPAPTPTATFPSAPATVFPASRASEIKIGAEYRFDALWSAGFGVVLAGSQYFRGDEANDMRPLAGFARLDLHGACRVARSAKLTLQIANVLDARYATFGELGDPRGVGAPGVPNSAGADFRFESPAAPRTILAGLEFEL